MRLSRRNKKFNISPFKIILPAVAMLFLLSLFLIIQSKIFVIKTVEVQLEKVGCVDDNQVKKFTNLQGLNIFLINSQKIEKDLKNKFVCIKSLTIEKKYPEKIVLRISGREPAAILLNLKSEESSSAGELENFSRTESSKSAESSPSANFNFSIDSTSQDNFVIDNEGVIYSNNTQDISVPVVYVSGLNLKLGQRMEEQVIQNLLKILEKVRLFGIGVKDAKMYSERIFLINAVPRIIFKLGSNVDIQIASLQLILNKAKIDNDSLEFIDLRFDKPIVRIAPKKK